MCRSFWPLATWRSSSFCQKRKESALQNPHTQTATGLWGLYKALPVSECHFPGAVPGSSHTSPSFSPALPPVCRSGGNLFHWREIRKNPPGLFQPAQQPPHAGFCQRSTVLLLFQGSQRIPATPSHCTWNRSRSCSCFSCSFRESSNLFSAASFCWNWLSRYRT